MMLIINMKNKHGKSSKQKQISEYHDMGVKSDTLLPMLLHYVFDKILNNGPYY